MTMAKTKRGQFEKLSILEGTICIVGDAPLMLNRFSAKAGYQMLANMMGVASSGREKREPEMDFIRACQFAEDDHMGVSAIALKKCAVRGAKITGMMDMVDARCSFRVVADAHMCIPVFGKFVMDQSMVRNSGGTTDIRFRPRADEWAMDVKVRYNSRAITPDQIAQLLEAGGFGVGLGEWRQEKGGVYGTFEVDVPEAVEAIRKRHEPAHKAFLKEYAPLRARVAAEDEAFMALFRKMDAAQAEALGLSGVIEDIRTPDGIKKMVDPKPRRRGGNGSSEHLEN